MWTVTLPIKYNIDKSFIKQQFVNTIKINSYHNLNNLIQFIEQNKIDVIINQGEHKLTKSLRLALNQSQNKKMQANVCTPRKSCHGN